MKNRIIFITGGVRSGKSRLAVELAGKLRRPVTFIATCEGKDGEMRARIGRHRAERPARWITVEEPLRLPHAVAAAGSGRTIVVDCLTLWVTNLLMKKKSDEDVLREADLLAGELARTRSHVILVSNETGWGLVPPNALGRRFRDLIGGVHQKVAAASTAVYLTVAGIPIRIK